METFSFSQIDTYRRCPQLHQYRYIAKKEAVEKALVLEFGSLWHSIMHLYYEAHTKPASILNAVWEAQYETAQEEAEAIGSDLDELETKWAKLYKRLEKGFANYIAALDRADFGYKFLWAEKELSMLGGLEVRDGQLQDQALFKIIGIPDLCVEWQDGTWLVSHKTSSQFEPLRYQWNDQDLLYLRLVDLNDTTPSELFVNGIVYHILDSTKLVPHFLPVPCTEAQVQDAVDRFKEDVEKIRQDTTHTAHPMWNCHMTCEFDSPCLAERAGMTPDWADYPQYRERQHRIEKEETE